MNEIRKREAYDKPSVKRKKKDTKMEMLEEDYAGRVIELKDEENMTWAEIAKELDSSKSAVKSLYKEFKAKEESSDGEESDRKKKKTPHKAAKPAKKKEESNSSKKRDTRPCNANDNVVYRTVVQGPSPDRRFNTHEVGASHLLSCSLTLTDQRSLRDHRRQAG